MYAKIRCIYMRLVLTDQEDNEHLSSIIWSQYFGWILNKTFTFQVQTEWYSLKLKFYLLLYLLLIGAICCVSLKFDKKWLLFQLKLNSKTRYLRHL